MIINPYRFAGVSLPTFGNASRDFDGTNDDITVSDPANFPTGAQTWCAWMKTDTLTGDPRNILGKNVDGGQASGRIRVNNVNNKLQAYFSTNGSTLFSVSSSNNSIDLNTWQHVAVEFSPSTHLKLYIDGIEDGSNTTSIPATIFDSTAPFCIGSLDNTQQYWNGHIADARIYDTNIGATQIANLAAGTDYQTNLVGWYLTDNDDVEDYAGDLGDGTDNGSTYSTDSPF